MDLALETLIMHLEVPIRGGEVLHGDSFVATGEEIQPNDKRYGISVQYNSDLQNFTIASGTTGEAIAGKGAIGVSEEQKASNIQIGRYALNENGVKTEQPYDVDAANYWQWRQFIVWCWFNQK